MDDISTGSRLCNTAEASCGWAYAWRLNVVGIVPTLVVLNGLPIILEIVVLNGFIGVVLKINCRCKGRGRNSKKVCKCVK